MAKYVISSREFKTLKEALEQIAEWEDMNTLHSQAKVYKVDKEYGVMWRPVLVEGGGEK